jgi:hypothetical protein
MQIRQLALHYRPEADRLLLRVNVSDGAQMAVWFTRRLCLRLWPHLNSLITRIGVAKESHRATLKDAIVTPEAQAMLAQSARERALRDADFKTPFSERAETHPLGTEPMVAVEVQLTPLSDGHLRLVIIDADKRNLQLHLTETMATAVKELMVKALRQADWGIEVADAAVPAAPPTPGSRLLN